MGAPESERLEMRIDIEEAGKQLAKLGSYVQIGEKVVITKGGEPYVELVPCPEYSESRKKDKGKSVRRVGILEGEIWMAPDFDETPEDLIDLFYDSPIFPTGGDGKMDAQR